jgi:hypothetical protein
MIGLSTGLTVFSEPLVLAALIALVFGALEGERIWTRSRRRRGLEPGAVAYLLDGLVIVGVALALVGAITLFVKGLAFIVAMVGEVIDGERVGLLIVGMALALGLALALARVASGRRAARDSAIASAAVTPPINPGALAAEAPLAGASEQQLAYAPLPRERFEEPPPPALAMMQERWQPADRPAASVPTSFLDLIEPHSNTPARSRFALASTLLILALTVMLVSSAVLFRHQLMNILSGMEASYGGVVEAGSSAPPNQPDIGAENAAANVGAAAASAASAPTVSSQPAAVVPAAPLSASDAQGAQKRVKSNGLNLRALPGTDQQVVVVLKQGDIVIVFTDARLIRDAIWVKVRAGDYEGWVDQSLLE